jgi:hypothetical protein
MEARMLVWSKRFAVAALIVFAVLELYLITQTSGKGPSAIHPHTIQYLLVNYSLLVLWVFTWMVDQTRVRGANVWPWLIPFLLAPLPTLLIFILFLQRPKKVG